MIIILPLCFFFLGGGGISQLHCKNLTDPRIAFASLGEPVFYNLVTNVFNFKAI